VRPSKALQRTQFQVQLWPMDELEGVLRWSGCCHRYPVSSRRQHLLEEVTGRSMRVLRCPRYRRRDSKEREACEV